MSVAYHCANSPPVLGWGTTEDGETTHLLQKLEYSFPDQAECRTAYADGMIAEGMVCTGEKPMTQEHSGTGDSGERTTKHLIIARENSKELLNCF